MIYIYGDSHAFFSFKNLKISHVNRARSAVTMFRIGRDNTIINLNKNTRFQINDVVVLTYGEIDCRCHLQKQINLGRNEDDVIDELVNNYFRTIRNNVRNLKVVIVGVIPTKKVDAELIGDPSNEYPFVGTNEDRVRYTMKLNKKLEEMANSHNYIYFNPYSYYTRADGTLKDELSDTNVHLGDNSYFLQQFSSMCKIKCPGQQLRMGLIK